MSADDEIRTDSKPAEAEIDLDQIPDLLMQMFIENGDDDLARAAVDQRLTWIAEPFDESGYRMVEVWFKSEKVALARFHWSDLAESTIAP